MNHAEYEKARALQFLDDLRNDTDGSLTAILRAVLKDEGTEVENPSVHSRLDSMQKEIEQLKQAQAQAEHDAQEARWAAMGDDL